MGTTQLTEQNFEEVVTSHDVVVIDFLGGVVWTVSKFRAHLRTRRRALPRRLIRQSRHRGRAKSGRSVQHHVHSYPLDHA